MTTNREENEQNHRRKLNETESVLCSLLSGAIAGACAKTTIAPLDRAKISFQISTKEYSAKEAWKFLRNTYEHEGLMNLWRGNSATMARIIPYAASQFAAHEQWKKVLKVDAAGVDHKSDPTLRRFLAGSLAGVTSQTLTYPLDLARARLAITTKKQYHNLSHVLVQTKNLEGWAAFYKGYVPTMLGIIPYAGTSFCTYGTLKNMYKEKFGAQSSTGINLIFGAISGMLGQSTSYPLDIVRRRMQTSSVTGYRCTTVFGTFVKIYREEGVRKGLFKGLSMNWVKGPISVGISFATYDRAKDNISLMITKMNT